MVKFLTVQGEFCGAGIQKNRLRLAQPDWFVFTVEINGKRIGMDELVSFCRRNGMKHVEIQEEGNDLTEVYPTAEDLIRRAEDVSKAKAYGGRQPEGIVIRPNTPVFSKCLSGNLSMKVLNNRYLLKKRRLKNGVRPIQKRCRKHHLVIRRNTIYNRYVISYLFSIYRIIYIMRS